MRFIKRSSPHAEQFRLRSSTRARMRAFHTRSSSGAFAANPAALEGRRDASVGRRGFSAAANAADADAGRGAFAGDFLVGAARGRTVRPRSALSPPRAARGAQVREETRGRVVRPERALLVQHRAQLRRTSIVALAKRSAARPGFKRTLAGRVFGAPTPPPPRAPRRLALARSPSPPRRSANAVPVSPRTAKPRSTQLSRRDTGTETTRRTGGTGPVETRAPTRSSEVEIVTFAVCVSGRDSATRRHTHERQMRRERGLRGIDPYPDRGDAMRGSSSASAATKRRDSRESSRESRRRFRFVFDFVPSARRVGGSRECDAPSVRSVCS